MGLEPRVVTIIDTSITSWRDDGVGEVWGMNDMVSLFPRWDRWFEMHHDFRGDGGGPEWYVPWLQEHHGKPIYMCQRHDDIPDSVEYPLARVVEVGGDFFTSTRAYMVGLAVLEGVDVIRLMGVAERNVDRSARSVRNVLYWLGVAAGRGVRVQLDASEGLVRSFQGDSPYVLYGYNIPSGEAAARGYVGLFD